MQKIGLFGGTFDPIHSGHIALARRVLDTFLLDKLIFIPAGNPPHKTARQITDKKHRFSMVLLAAREDPRFFVSDYELNNEGPNYSYITISHFKTQYPEDEFFFIVGGDSFRDFPCWKNYRTLISMCTFVVVSRPGVDPARYFEKFQGDETPPRVLFLNDFSQDVSSTKIRQRLASGKEITGQVPPCVEQYIKTNQLYRSRT